jgi:hypothetical protein
MAEGRKWWVTLGALGSALAPVAVLGLTPLCSGPPTWTRRILIGAAAAAIMLVGFTLGIVALVRSLRRDCMGSTCLAGAALGLNGIFLHLFVATFLVGAHARTTGYTVEQMRVMPRVIPGSREVLNEALGFRLEVPDGFLDNEQPQPSQVLYAFVHADGNEVDLCINIERLGGRVVRGPAEPEFYEGMRRWMPPDAQVDQAVVLWKTHQLDAFRMQFSTKGRLVCVWGVQVPLAREAIQVLVCGRPDASEECRRLLEQLLMGLQGISNWDPPSPRMAWGPSRWPGPRASQAAEPAPPTARR